MTVDGDQVEEIATRWGLDPTGWSVLGDGPNLTLHLPAAQAVAHVCRPEVGPERVTAVQQARRILAAAGVPVVPWVTSRAGATWELVDDHVVEVEPWVPHDGRMNTWPRLRPGASLLARVHDAWADLDLGAGGEACDWANWITPADVRSGAAATAPRLRGWGWDALADDVLRLAEHTADDHRLPTQVVHGDFWDNNVYVRDEELVAVTDLDFLGRRPRVDDLALLLYFADEQPHFHGSGPRDVATRIADLTPLVRAYDDALTSPLSEAEIVALPFALARQPLWTYGKWLPMITDEEHARRDAEETAPAVPRALEIMNDPARWSDAFRGS